MGKQGDDTGASVNRGNVFRLTRYWRAYGVAHQSAVGVARALGGP